MRILLFLVATFACAVMGWNVYSQPGSAGSDKPPAFVQTSRSSRPDFGVYQFHAVAEEKREESAIAECDQRVATKRLTYDDRLAFIERCLQAIDSARPGHQQ
jgi:hypothetical protein